MSAWAGLAGAAQGVSGAWDDNREAIKEQAKRDFQVALEETRMTNAKKASDQLATDMLDPSTPQGALAKHNADAETASSNAKWEREAERDRLERKNKLSVAQAKSGKSADSGELKYVLGQIKRQDAVLADEYASESDKAAARKELEALDVKHRQLSGMEPRKAKKTKEEFYADVHKSKNDPNAMAQLEAKLGPDRFKQVMDEVGKLYPAPVQEEVADDTNAGEVASWRKDEAQKQQARGDAAKSKANSSKETANASAFIKELKDGITPGRGVVGYLAGRTSDRIDRLSAIADNKNIDKKTRQEAQSLLKKAMKLESDKRSKESTQQPRLY